MGFLNRYRDELQGILRIVTGLLFMQHGAQKLFGWASENPAVEWLSFMGFAGILEFFGGLLIVLGLFTAPVAFLLSGQMAAAYFMAHAPQGPIPVVNRGELAALYCFVFLYFAAAGPGRFSVDGAMRRKSADADETQRAAPSARATAGRA